MLITNERLISFKSKYDNLKRSLSSSDSDECCSLISDISLGTKSNVITDITRSANDKKGVYLDCCYDKFISFINMEYKLNQMNIIIK